jgi:hypothetical protein
MSRYSENWLKHEKGAEGTTRVRNDVKANRVQQLQGELERKRAE